MGSMDMLGSNIAIGGVMRSPMMRFTVPFVAGILVAMRWPIPLVNAGVLLILTTLVALFSLWWRMPPGGQWRHAPGVLLWCFMFGVFWQLIRDPLTRPDHVRVDGPEMHYRAMRIISVNGITEKVIRTDAKVLSMNSADGTEPRSGQVMLTLMRRPGAADPVRGDLVFVNSRVEAITRIPDPGGFDRRSWAASRGMYHETFAGPEAWTVQGHSARWTDLFEGVRQQVASWLVESGLPPRERALVRALVLGLRDELEGDQRTAFVQSGTIHVLAVSGTHVGIIYAMLAFMFGWWGGGGKARVWRGLLILAALWGYAGLTGGSPSVLRATIMFSLFTLAGMSSRRADPLNSLFTAAFLLLMWEPHMLIEIGFQLSFLAVFGIVLFHRSIERLWVPNNAWVGRIWTLTVLSISAQLLTTPFSLFYFKAFPIWFLPANLFVVTAVAFAVYGSIILLVVYKLPLIGPLVVTLLTWLLVAVDRVTTFFGSLPGAYPAIRIGSWDVVLLLLLVFSAAGWLMLRLRWAKFIALLSVCSMLIGWATHLRSREERTAFTVYDDRQALQASFTVGRDLVVLNDDPSGKLDAWLDEKVLRHQRAEGALDVQYVTTEHLFASMPTERSNTICGVGRWCAPGMTVRFFNDGTPTDEANATCNVLVIHGVRYLSTDELERVAKDCERVVLAGGLSWKLRGAVQRWCSERELPCHDVRDQGAFVFEGRAR